MNLQRFKIILPWLVLVLGISATYSLMQEAATHTQLHLRKDFEKEASFLANQIEDRLETHSQVLRGVSSFFTHSQQVTAKEFQQYVSYLLLRKRTPGVLGIGFATVTHTGDGVSKIQASKMQGLQTKIKLLEPKTPRLRGMIGHDMYAEPGRRAAMDISRDLFRPAMTGMIRLKQELDEDFQHGFLMYFPVYRYNHPHDTIAERRQNIAGWVFSPFRADDLIDGIVKKYDTTGLALTIYDGNGPSPATRLTRESADVAHTSGITPLVFERKIEVAGHSWFVEIRALPSFYADTGNQYSEIILISGSLISTLLFLYAWNLTQAHRRAEAIAGEMTRDLQESEIRWKFATEGIGDGVWDWDILRNTFIYSDQWKKMLSVSDNEIGSSYEEWQNRIHTNDKPTVLKALQEYMEGNNNTYRSEYRLQRNTGDWLWVLDRGMAISRASDGHPLRMIGTITDIGSRKNAERSIHRLTQLYNALSLCNQAIVRCDNEPALFSEVCRIAVQYGGMKMAWIGLNDARTGQIQTAGAYGMSVEYLDGIHITLNLDDPSVMNPFAEAMRENSPVWHQDFLNDHTTARWHARAIQHGWCSIGVLPLRKAGVRVGAFALYAAETNAFTEDVQGLLCEMAEDISAAMNHFANEEDRRQAVQSLQESEARYNALFADSSVTMLLIDPSSGSILNANHQASTFYGWDHATLCAMNIRDINARHPEQIQSDMMRALQQEKGHFLFQHRRAFGDVRDVEVFAGSVDVNGQSLLLSSIHDITERKRAEQALRESESFNTGILDSLSEHIAVVDTHGVIVAVNRAWLQFAGQNGAPDAAEYWIGINYLDVCGSGIYASGHEESALAQIGINAVLSGAQDNFRLEYPCDSPTDAHWFVMRVNPLQHSHPGAVISHENITSRKRFEIEINESRARLGYLSAKLIETQELERKALARELHDEMGQRFTALNMNLHQLRPFLDGQEADRVWVKASESISTLIDRVRSMSGSLRPPTLDHLGLEAAVGQLLQEHFSNSPISYGFEYAGLPKKLSAQIEITVYRFVQEGITNIVRHAGATHVMVEINGGEGGSEIEIILRDNGVGFDFSSLAMHDSGERHFGLIGMEERIKMLSGTFDVHSVIGKGTRLAALLPLNVKHDQAKH
jgi:PAS domain S-box-containing protein